MFEQSLSSTLANLALLHELDMPALKSYCGSIVKASKSVNQEGNPNYLASYRASLDRLLPLIAEEKYVDAQKDLVQACAVLFCLYKSIDLPTSLESSIQAVTDALDDFGYSFLIRADVIDCDQSAVESSDSILRVQLVTEFPLHFGPGGKIRLGGLAASEWLSLMVEDISHDTPERLWHDRLNADSSEATYSFNSTGCALSKVFLSIAQNGIPVGRSPLSSLVDLHP